MSPDTQNVITTRCGWPSSPTVASLTTGADASRARATCSGRVISLRVGESRPLTGIRRPRVDLSVRAQDVDHEDQSVGALDPRAGGAGLAVAVLGRDDEQHPAADLLADERLVPAGDDLAAADGERGGRATRPGGVEDLSGLPDLPVVLRDQGLALGHRRAGALDEGLVLGAVRGVGLRDRDGRRLAGARVGHLGQFRIIERYGGAVRR